MKSKKLVIALIIFILVLLLGASYAWFNYYQQGKNSKLIMADLYLKYIEGNDSIMLTNVLPETGVEARNATGNTLTFDVEGKNTTDENIVYNIKIIYGDDDLERERFFDETLRFDLIEIDSNDNEIYLVSAGSFSSIENQTLWTEVVPGGTNVAVTKRYKIRMWLSSDVLISDTDPSATYPATGDHAFYNRYASIKVLVTGEIGTLTRVSNANYLSSENDGIGSVKSINNNRITLNTTLPSIDSTVTYNVTVTNNNNSAQQIVGPTVVSNSNSDITYEVIGLDNADVLANSSKTFKIKIKYNTETLPSDTTDEMVLSYSYSNSTAGTQYNPIQIMYIEDLVDLAVNVNSGTTYSGQYVKMMRDLDFNDNSSYRDYTDSTTYGDYNGDSTTSGIKEELTTGSGWQAIGTSITGFNGSFDGNNNTISNLYINSSDTSTSEGFGLFGMIQNASIKNLKINGNIGLSSGPAGSIAGRNYGTSYIDNCVNNVNIVSVDTTNGNIGGFFGNAGGTLTISNSSNNGKIKGGSSSGGLIGFVGNTALISINNTYNSGEVIQNGGRYAGGLIGRDSASASTINITNSYNKGNVVLDIQNSSSVRSIGGLVGLVNGLININKSYNQGDVESNVNTTTHTLNVGGFIGRLYQNGVMTIEDSHNSGSVSGTQTGGLIGYISRSSQGGIIINKCYNRGKITAELLPNNSNTNGGGLIGGLGSGDLYILNSYNKGNITSRDASSGIVGYQSASSNMAVVNSYNAGNVLSTNNVAIGISLLLASRYNTVINNVYNIGSLTSASSLDSKGIIYDTAYSNSGYTTTINNAYYLNNVSSGSNDYESYTTSMTRADMKSSTFVSTLNTNKASINLSSISSDLSSYTLSNWKLGSDGIPTLDN